jgi:hypothetical protein
MKRFKGFQLSKQNQEQLVLMTTHEKLEKGLEFGEE